MSDSSHGWGYLGGMVEATNGVVGSIQVRVDNSKLGGDSGFVYDTATGIVTITGGLIVAGTPVGQGNMSTIPEDATQAYQANSMNVIYTEDTDTVTIQPGAIMDIGLDATVKMKRYSEV